MNNKGFAITGIIYALFIIFLIIILSISSKIISFQRMLITSTESITNSFEGKKINDTELQHIKNNNIVLYTGKYIFKSNTVPELECYTYLNKGTIIDANTIILSPNICNESIEDLELLEVYKFDKGE